MLGSARIGLGSVRIAAGDLGGDGGGVVPGAGEIILGEVSYGVGVPNVDDVVPVAAGGVRAHLGVGMTIDSIGTPTADLAASPRYGFAVPVALRRIELRVFITRLDATIGEAIGGVGGVITIDGERDTSLAWGLSALGGVSATNVVQTPAADIVALPGQHVGVTIETNAGQLTARCQVHIVIVGVGDSDPELGPFVSDNLILRLESDVGVIADSDTGVVSTWTNQAATGAPFDAIAMGGASPRPSGSLIANQINGLPVVRFGLNPSAVAGGNAMIARGYPIAPFPPNVANKFAPRYYAFAGRCTLTDVYSTGLLIWFNAAGPGVGANTASCCLQVPIDAAAAGDRSAVAFSNGPGFNERRNQPVPLVSLSGQPVVVEHWVDDAGALHCAINGGELTLDTTDPNPNGAPAPTIQFYSIGANPTGFTQTGLGQTSLTDNVAHFAYNICPPGGRRAQTRNYLMRKVGLLA